MHAEPRRLVILGRDGVINQARPGPVKAANEWVALPGSLEAIARLSHAGFSVIIATNQPGIDQGDLGIAELDAIHEKFQRALARVGGHIDGIFFCPHSPEAGCRCRKPATGLFESIAERFHVGLAQVPVIGDAAEDAEAALAVGARPLMVRTGLGARSYLENPALQRLEWFDDLASATCFLLDRPTVS
jgi:D-glycero-D-manno-heptose 1,7-bisphosphate phosphatase